MSRIKWFFWAVRNRLLHIMGYLTASWRADPDFLIIGAQKGGTSSLFYYLKFHPSVKRPIKKEIHFFNFHYDKGLKWYRAFFPLKSDSFITGEASPDYMFHPEAAKRAHQLSNEMKIIALLRNPIDRAYSAYQMNRRMGLDKHETFQDAINYELNAKVDHDHEYTYERHNFFYLERGKYAMLLDKWQKQFGKDQILVVQSESFFINTKKELFKIHQFLGLKPILPPTFRPMNVGKYSAMPNDLYKRLTQYFEEDLAVLKEKWNIEFAMQ